MGLGEYMYQAKTDFNNFNNQVCWRTHQLPYDEYTVQFISCKLRYIKRQYGTREELYLCTRLVVVGGDYNGYPLAEIMRFETEHYQKKVVYRMQAILDLLKSDLSESDCQNEETFASALDKKLSGKCFRVLARKSGVGNSRTAIDYLGAVSLTVSKTDFTASVDQNMDDIIKVSRSYILESEIIPKSDLSFGDLPEISDETRQD